MTTKQYLSRYRKFMSDIVFYENMKENVIKDIASLKSPSFDEQVQGSPKNDPIGELVIELEKDIGKYNLEIINCKAKMILIDNQIRKLKEINEDYYKLLSYRYEIGFDWKQISEKILMSRSTMNRIHGAALLKFDELFGETYKKL